MDAKQFDDLTRRFAGKGSRRRFLKMTAGGLGVAATSGAVPSLKAAAAQQCGELGTTCGSDAECCAEYGCTTSGTCGFVDTPCAQAGGDCVSDPDCCSGMYCTTSQTCGFQDAPNTPVSSDIDTLPNTGAGSKSVDSRSGMLVAVAGIVAMAAAALKHQEKSENDPT